MKIVVATDRRFFRHTDGSPCCKDGVKGYRFWTRYLEVFDSIIIVARLSQEIAETGTHVEGERVSLMPLENYQGLEQYLRRRNRLLHQIDRLAEHEGAFLLRIPSQIGSLLHNHLQQRCYPYAVEVVGDPYEVFTNGASRSRMRSLIRWVNTRRMKAQCRLASGVSYVTAMNLQARYPAGPQSFVTNYSSVDMPSEAYVPLPRSAGSFGSRSRLVFVGSMNQPYKGVHILLDAVAQCLKTGVDLCLTVIGAGKYKSEMEKRCQTMDIASRVRFLGRLSAGEQVRNQFDQADLCVLPSFTEGLPRVLIEAMGRGLPCIGSDVGGIPELLDAECIVPARQMTPLAKKITEVLADPVRMARESRRNLEVAQGYHADVLARRRTDFYEHLRAQTQAWMPRKAA